MFFRLLYSEVVYGGHLLALGTASIAAAAALLIGQTPAAALLFMAYLFSYGAYAMNRASEMDRDAVSNPSRTGYLVRRRRYIPLIVLVCFALGYALAALRNAYFFAALLIPLVLSLAYSVGSKRLVRVMGVSRLKDRLFLKNVVISLAWSLIPILVGLYYERFLLSLFLLAPFIFLRLMANTVFFDVRDRAVDASFDVMTIPVVFGLARASRLMDVMDLLSGAYVGLVVVAAAFPTSALILALLPVYSLSYRHLGRRFGVSINVLCDLVADGEYLFWGPLIYLARI